jgi:uncharacterized membrane protein YdjX (TVP38/TMEM64 family)
MTVHKKLRRHIVTVGLLIVAAGLISGSETLHDKADALIVWAESVIELSPHIGMAVFVLIAMLSAMLAFLSSAVFVPVAVYTWGAGVTFILLWAGWLLGGVVSFCIGRFLGRRVAAILIGEEKLAGWQSQLTQRSRFIHILLFQAVLPSEIPGYVLGILRYRFSLYLTALAITELPYVIGVIYLGESFLSGEGTIIIVLGIAVVVLGIVSIGFKGNGSFSQ